MLHWIAVGFLIAVGWSCFKGLPGAIAGVLEAIGDWGRRSAEKDALRQDQERSKRLAEEWREVRPIVMGRINPGQPR